MAREPHDPESPETDDKYARESFTFRGMKTWQLWGITAAAVLVVILGLAYGIA